MEIAMQGNNWMQHFPIALGFASIVVFSLVLVLPKGVSSSRIERLLSAMAFFACALAIYSLATMSGHVTNGSQATAPLVELVVGLSLLNTANTVKLRNKCNSLENKCNDLENRINSSNGKPLRQQ